MLKKVQQHMCFDDEKNVIIIIIIIVFTFLILFIIIGILKICFFFDYY